MAHGGLHLLPDHAPPRQALDLIYLAKGFLDPPILTQSLLTLLQLVRKQFFNSVLAALMIDFNSSFIV